MGAAQARLIRGALPRRYARGGDARGQGWSGETGPRQLIARGQPPPVRRCFLSLNLLT